MIEPRSHFGMLCFAALFLVTFAMPSGIQARSVITVESVRDTQLLPSSGANVMLNTTEEDVLNELAKLRLNSLCLNLHTPNSLTLIKWLATIKELNELVVIVDSEDTFVQLCKAGLRVEILQITLKQQPSGGSATGLTTWPRLREIRLLQKATFACQYMRVLGDCSQLRSITVDSIGGAELSCITSLADHVPIEHITLTNVTSLTSDCFVGLSKFDECISLVLHSYEKPDASQFRFIEKMTKLKTIALKGTFRVGDAACRYISRCFQLESVDVSGCNEVSNAGLFALGALTKLRTLILPKGLGITDEGLLNFPRVNQIESLSIIGELPVEAKSITCFINLLELRIYRAPKLVSKLISSEGHPALRSVCFERCECTDAVQVWIAKCPSLRSINFAGDTVLSSKAISRLIVIECLTTIILDECINVTDECFAEIGKRNSTMEYLSLQRISTLSIRGLRAIAQSNRVSVVDVRHSGVAMNSIRELREAQPLTGIVR